MATGCLVKPCTQNKKKKIHVYFSFCRVEIQNPAPSDFFSKSKRGRLRSTWTTLTFQTSPLGAFSCIRMRLGGFRLIKSAQHNVNISVTICQHGELRLHYIYSLIQSNISKPRLCKSADENIQRLHAGNSFSCTLSNHNTDIDTM